jgi:hypothetical protein
MGCEQIKLNLSTENPQINNISLKLSMLKINFKSITDLKVRAKNLNIQAAIFLIIVLKTKIITNKIKIYKMNVIKINFTTLKIFPV